MSSDTHDVYVYMADQPIHKTVGGGIVGVNIDLAVDGDAVGVECLGARSVTIDGRPVAAPSPAVDREALAVAIRDATVAHHVGGSRRLCDPEDLADALISAGWVRGPVEQPSRDVLAKVMHVAEHIESAALGVPQTGKP